MTKQDNYQTGSNNGDNYSSNISLLKKYHPVTYKFMTESPPDSVGKIFMAANGMPNLQVVDHDDNEVNIHDETDPEIEVPQFLNLVPEESTGVVILLGMGLGYTPQVLLKQRPNIRHLIVFELNPGIFRQALQYMDLSSLFSDSRLILCVTPHPNIPEVIAPAARALQLESIHTLNLLRAFSINKSAYKDLSDKLYSITNDLNLEGATKWSQGAHLMSNRFKHLTSIHHDYLLESLQGQFSGFPAILVAAGPSLDKNIHYLSQSKNRAVIIAVDSVLPTLLHHDIIPDFVTAIDYDPFIHEKIIDSSPYVKNVSLICMPWVGPTVTKRFQAERVFWCFTKNPVENWINTMLGGKLVTGGAGTVAHLNLIAAIIMGCSPIIYVGQDLCLSETRDHAEHVVFGYFNDSEKEKESLLVKGTDGSMLPTRRDFLSYKRTFERMMHFDPGHYINATEKGAHLEGTEVMPLGKALECHGTKSLDVLGLINERCKESGLSDTGRLMSELQQVHKNVKNIKKQIKKVDNLVSFVRKKLILQEQSGITFYSVSDFPTFLQKKISEIDICNNNIDNAYNIWELLQDLTMDGLKHSERMLHDIKRLEGIPGKYQEWFLKNLERLNSISSVRKKVLSWFEKQLSTVMKHLEKEKSLLRQVKQEPRNSGLLLELSRFYYDSGNLVPARSVLEKLNSVKPGNAHCLYYLGCIAARQAEYDKSDGLFKKAEQIMPDIKSGIREFRHHLGEEYYDYVQSLKNDADKNSCRKMLLKGLRYCRDHKKIRDEIQKMAVADLKEIATVAETNMLDNARDLINCWYLDLEANKLLSSCLFPDQKAEFYKYYGSMLMSDGDYHNAVVSYEKSLEIFPDKPECHILLMDVMFAQGFFTQGLEHLKKAIMLDRNYGIYWENIGDLLNNTDQTSEAIFAYEQSFISVPENISALKKLGDCYMKLGHPEAANEAFKQYQAKVDTVSMFHGNNKGSTEMGF